MMFARTDGLHPLHRPQLVLLSAGEGLDASAETACRDAAEDGFDVVVVPWRSLVWQLDGAAAVAGLVVTPMGSQPITRSTRLMPELITAIDWLEPPGLCAGTRLGLLNPDAVLGCSEQAPAAEDKAPAISGVLALAPLVIRAVGSRKSDAARLRQIAEVLSRVPAGGDRSALADPTRMVLAVNGKVFGFRERAGAPVDAGLFAAWRGLARQRIAPPAPILLPTARPSSPALLRGGLTPLKTA
ncbi:MAG TPA: hypothetical protein VK362_03040, partial [Reyranella sp.]|nr:hypothetical protein [Reyranella sp.]